MKSHVLELFLRWPKVSRVREWKNLNSAESNYFLSFRLSFLHFFPMCDWNFIHQNFFTHLSNVYTSRCGASVDRSTRYNFQINFFLSIFSSSKCRLHFQIVIESHDDWMMMRKNLFSLSSSSHLSLLTTHFHLFHFFFFFFPVNGHNFEIDEGWKKNSIQKHHKDLIFFYVCWYDESAYLRMICNSPLFWCWWVKLCIIIEKCTK